MRILCPVKLVPDTLEVHMGSDLTLQRDFVAQVINKADESAVELALQLKERSGAEVTVLTMGPEKAEGALRDLIARGIDHAILLTSPAFAGSDTLATAHALAAAAQKLGPFDLILFGRRAADGETGQVGPMTAALLDIPCIANVTHAETDGSRVTASQLLESGVREWTAALPAALTMCEWSYPLRLPTMRGLRLARTAEVARKVPADLGLTLGIVGLKGSPTRVIHAGAKPAGVRPTKWITPAEAADILNGAKEQQA